MILIMHFRRPEDLKCHSDGNIYISDDNHLISKLDSSFNGTIIAGPNSSQPGYFDGPANVSRFNYPRHLAVSPNGDIFVSVFRLEFCNCT